MSKTILHWQKGAVKRPGALTRKAHAAGMSPMAFAHKHYHDSGLTGEQARYAVNAQVRRRPHKTIAHGSR